MRGKTEAEKQNREGKKRKRSREQEHNIKRRNIMTDAGDRIS